MFARHYTCIARFQWFHQNWAVLVFYQRCRKEFLAFLQECRATCQSRNLIFHIIDEIAVIHVGYFILIMTPTIVNIFAFRAVFWTINVVHNSAMRLLSAQNGLKRMLDSNALMFNDDLLWNPTIQYIQIVTEFMQIFCGTIQWIDCSVRPCIGESDCNGCAIIMAFDFSDRGGMQDNGDGLHLFLAHRCRLECHGNCLTHLDKCMDVCFWAMTILYAKSNFKF